MSMDGIDKAKKVGWYLAASSTTIILMVLVGSSVTEAVVAQQYGGWALWHYPLLALAPVVCCLLISGAICYGINRWLMHRIPNILRSEFAQVVQFFLLALVLFNLRGDWFLAASISFSPMVDAEAESLFYHSWPDISHQLVAGSSFLAIALAGFCFLSHRRFTALIVAVIALLGLIDLGQAAIELVSLMR